MFIFILNLNNDKNKLFFNWFLVVIVYKLMLFYLVWRNF